MEFIIKVIFWTLALYGLFEIIKNIIYISTYTNFKSDGIYVIIAVKNQEEKIEGFMRSALFKLLYGRDDYVKNIIVTDLKSGDNTQSLTTSQAEDTSSAEPQHYAFNSPLHTETLAFAQQSTGTYRYNPETDSSITFVDAPTPDIDSPFAGSRNELKDLERLNPIYNTAVKGMKIHNLIQSLPSKKALFDQYHQYEKLHEKAVAKVKESDNCALRYLSKYYQNPEQTWYGAYIGEQVTDYDLRKGVSGWAISSYDTAKAALSNPIDSEDLAEMELDASLDGTKYENIASQKSYVEDQSASFDGYKEQSQYDTNEANTRIEELLPWNIGAEAAKELADDQYSGSPQWGSPKTLFPVWNDQKSFYGQYLNGKYANMKNYLSRFDFRNRIVLVAQILNSLSDARLELKQYAAKVLSSMASGTSDIVEYPSDGNPDITSAAEEKKAAIETLQKNLEAALQAQEQSRAALVKQLDSAQTRQDELNRQINRAQNANMNEDVKLMRKSLTSEKLMCKKSRILSSNTLHLWSISKIPSLKS